jgi:capsid protein
VSETTTPFPGAKPRRSVLDRAVSWLSPKWSAERTAWRKIEASYRGGSATRTSEGYDRSSGYPFGTAGERQEMVQARDRAYQAYRDNPVARTIADTEADNVIGDGLNYQPTTDSEAWNREAKDRYYQWLEDCSVRGPDYESGCEVERTLWSRGRVAGSIGWVLVNAGTPERLDQRIQIIPREQIQTPDGKHGDPSIYDGVKFNQLGRPTEFYVLTQDDRLGRRDFVTVPARDFVFMPHTTEPNQVHGPSCYSTIFDLMAHLDRYVDGVSLAAWMATVMGIIFKQNNGAKQLAALGTLTNSQGVQQKAITFERGMVKYIGTDEEVAQVQAQQPMQQTPEFIRTMYRMLGQPFDMPLEVIAKDMSTCNFASARIGLLPFYRTCRIKAARFASRWSRTIRWWLSKEAARADDDPKKWVTEFPELYWPHDLLVNAWDYTDPVSEAQADLLQIDMGTKSHKHVISERGRDAEQLLRDNTEWKKKTKDSPPVHSTMTRDQMPEPVAAAPAPAPDDEDDEEEVASAMSRVPPRFQRL